jgi:hypothetical protein
MAGNRPKLPFCKEWLEPELDTIIDFAINSDMSWAQIRRILIQRIEEREVYIDDR